MMKHLERYFIFSFSLLFLIATLVMPALGQGEKKEDLIGQQTVPSNYGIRYKMQNAIG